MPKSQFKAAEKEAQQTVSGTETVHAGLWPLQGHAVTISVVLNTCTVYEVSVKIWCVIYVARCAQNAPGCILGQREPLRKVRLGLPPSRWPSMLEKRMQL